jgi:acetyltransferase-like isoleucine patch superfamily enzyme
MVVNMAQTVRVAWTIVLILVVQSLVCGLALGPIVLVWLPLARLDVPISVRLAVYATAAIPSYVGFALLLMFVSPIASRLTGARTVDEAELELAELGWPLLGWVRYQVGIHVVRVFAGPLFRGSPLWTAYVRRNGARIGRRVYINTLAMSDHNLLEIGDDVVIGDGVHLSGHTVEAGRLRTGRVRIGSHVTIGLESIVDIDVVIASGCQIGALSLVPKHARLTTPGIYAGIPARPLTLDQPPAGHARGRESEPRQPRH